MSVSLNYCLRHRAVLPDRYPVQPRPDMAVRLPLVVATRGVDALLCGCEHEGQHLWPDGEAVPPGEPAEQVTAEEPAEG